MRPPRRTGSALDKAEAAFKAATSKPVQRPPRPRPRPRARRWSPCGSTAPCSSIFRKTARAGSCADLTGKAINALSTAPRDADRAIDTITADDCAQVAAIGLAVELRLDPTDQCSFEPQLAPGDPGTCGEGFTETDVFTEDFENGLDTWTRESESVYGGETFPWTATRQYRGDHRSTVAFSPDPTRATAPAPPPTSPRSTT